MVLNKMAEKAVEQLAEELVQKLVVSKIEKFANWSSDKYNKLLIPKAEYFREYIKRSYEKYSIINTLVFHNSQRELKDIYVAQTLIKENRSEGIEDTTKIDGIPVELIKKYKRILITDTAGMGKSTIMKRMFIDLIDKGICEIGIPLYIELNKLRKDCTILQIIQEELAPLSKEFDKDLYLGFIQTGGFIFFLDGYDEISIADRDSVAQDIKSFISKAGTNNHYLLTSRPEDSLTSFGDFQLFKIQPLIKEEAFDLLRKYDLTKNKELSGKLMELLESEQYVSVREFLKNPLLVSLLFTAYDYNRSIPFEKHRFYEKVVEAYFEKHDNTKPLPKREKHSGLNYDGFDRVLRYLGYDCLVRTGVKFNEDTILNSIRKAKVFCGNLDFSESMFLKDLTSSVPLFSKDGNDFKWVHKSLLEYFAARFIFCDAKQNQDKILTAIYNSEYASKYENMLDLYYDIDLKGFSKNLTLPLCERFIEFYDKNLDTVIISKEISNELIEERVSFLFQVKTAFLISSLGAHEDVNLIFHETESKFEFVDTIKIQNTKDYRVYFTLENPTMRYCLARLLSKKKTAIVTYAASKGYEAFSNLFDVGLSKEISMFEHNKVHVICLITGHQSKELYNSINQMQFQYLDVLFNYDACKKEVERIKKEIAQSEDTSGLLAGI